MEAARLRAQLSDGICLWFALTFFSHWVIQNYNMHTTLVLKIPQGITATLCSHATPKMSYEDGSETAKNDTQEKWPEGEKGIYSLLKTHRDIGAT